MIKGTTIPRLRPGQTIEQYRAAEKEAHRSVDSYGDSGKGSGAVIGKQTKALIGQTFQNQKDLMKLYGDSSIDYQQKALEVADPFRQKDRDQAYKMGQLESYTKRDVADIESNANMLRASSDALGSLGQAAISSGANLSNALASAYRRVRD